MCFSLSQHLCPGSLSLFGWDCMARIALSMSKVYFQNKLLLVLLGLALARPPASSTTAQIVRSVAAAAAAATQRTRDDRAGNILPGDTHSRIRHTCKRGCPQNTQPPHKCVCKCLQVSAVWGQCGKICHTTERLDWTRLSRAVLNRLIAKNTRKKTQYRTTRRLRIYDGLFGLDCSGTGCCVYCVEWASLYLMSVLGANKRLSLSLSLSHVVSANRLWCRGNRHHNERVSGLLWVADIRQETLEPWKCGFHTIPIAGEPIHRVHRI